MLIIIVGAGIVGKLLAKHLIDEKKDLVIIEKDPEVVRHVSNQLDCLIINDSGNKPDVLEKAGVKRADFLISLTGSDEMNMIICGIAADISPATTTIARIRNADYLKNKPENDDRQDKGASYRAAADPFVGINYMVNPDIESSQAIIKAIDHGALSDIMLFEETDLELTNLVIDERSPFRDLPIRDLRKSLNLTFLIVAVIRQDDFIIPRGETVLQEGDIVYLFAEEDVLTKLFEYSGRGKTSINKVAIIGGGKIGVAVAQYLLNVTGERASFFSKIRSFLARKSKRRVTIIERNYEKCKHLSELLPDALVLNSDITDEGFVEEEDIEDFDLIITTTDNPELNLVTALYAKKQGVKKAIALVNKPGYIPMGTQLGIDVVISLKDRMANKMLKFIRKGSIRNIYGIAGGKLEILELNLAGAAPSLLGKILSQIKLPKDTLILAVTREDKTIIPDGTFMLQENDTIIILTTQESIDKVEDLFSRRV